MRNDVLQRDETNRVCITTMGEGCMEIKKQQFKSFEGINELIITHGPHVKSIEIAQYIIDLQNEVVMLKDIIQDLKQREKKTEKVLDLTG